VISDASAIVLIRRNDDAVSDQQGRFALDPADAVDPANVIRSHHPLAQPPVSFPYSVSL